MIYFWTILAYLMVLIGVGMYRSRSIKTQEDFMVAGRGLGPFVLVGTLLATWMGSGSLFGGAGLGYARGFSGLWFDAGVWIAIIILYTIAGRVRAFAQFTVPDILEARYHPVARVLGAVITIIAYTAIVSYQYRAGGLVLNLVTGMPEETGRIITMVFVIVYTGLAGMISVANTDVVNGVIMTLGMFIVFPFLLIKAGGWEGVTAALPPDRFTVFGTMTVMEALSFTLPTMLLLLGEANMYQRFFSAKSPAVAKRAVLGWLSGTIILEVLICVIAIIGSSLFLDINPENVILYVVQHGIPVPVGCVLLAAIVAMIVSTADSFLLAPSTNFVRDIYQRFLNPEASQKRIIFYSRISVFILGLFAFVQLQFFQNILEMALYAYTMYGVGVTPAVLAAFLWKRANASGAILSMSGGMFTTLIWELSGHPFGLQTVYPALFVSLTGLIAGSLFTAPPAPEKLEPFRDSTI